MVNYYNNANIFSQRNSEKIALFILLFCFYGIVIADPTSEAISPTESPLNTKADNKHICTGSVRSGIINAIYSYISIFSIESAQRDNQVDLTNTLKNIMTNKISYYGYAYSVSGLDKVTKYAANIKKKIQDDYDYNLYSNIQNLSIKSMPNFPVFTDGSAGGACKANWALKIFSKTRRSHYPSIGYYSYNAIFTPNGQMQVLRITEINKEYICPPSSYNKNTFYNKGPKEVKDHCRMIT